MGPQSLSIILSPTLNVGGEVLVAFMADYDKIFTPEDLPPLPPTWPEIEMRKLYKPNSVTTSTTKENEASSCNNSDDDDDDDNDSNH